jgi:hypothetical protein
MGQVGGDIGHGCQGVTAGGQGPESADRLILAPLAHQLEQDVLIKVLKLRVSRAVRSEVES